ncbi:MAG: GIY-YIG nuclease family protein [Candidatus Latescibacteria bacterium]|nr:GIY-YIG nuclease family protein [Candidatus Latescibacterota bacterium]
MCGHFLYYLYILKCKDGTLYTGITVDLDRRVEEHNSSKRGAVCCSLGGVAIYVGL